ncbi:catabolite gene activator protein [Clostridium sulfidigenes]|uniref:Catabolite gene activator protein n=1 Tax=Clostridium sulfidigenes TaxID=318464 RepID=A0A084JGS1_9CLOT|nr:transcriptional regulator YeiL [Clostridium sulfidigenes]KEZ88155.1 catabolite gene activator protein [Clostridium sulfidigenes]
MKKINNSELMNTYINKYNINDIFTSDMREYMELFHFKRNEFLCKEDEPIDYLFFFVEGKAKVYISLKNGKSLLICFYYPLMVLGDLELINFTKATTNMEVIEDAYCIGLSFKKVREKLLNDPKFLRFICSSLGNKMDTSSRNGSINLLYPLENRLASYIMATREEGNRVVFNETLTEIAELLGTSYRHLLRTINNLINREVLKKDNYGYEIINEEILSSLAVDLYK